MDLTQYFDKYQSKIRQASEQLFVQEFLYPLLGSKLEAIEPQYPFIDSTGKHRYIDFAYQGSTNRLAFEVNGESYHAEGIISDETFDDNLFRQNEILRSGYRLLRFSYNQLQSPQWRSIVQETLKDFLGTHAPELVSEYSLEPSPLQKEVLDAVDFYRNQRSWDKGVIILPTGTGKTILSAIDAKRCGGRVLFLVHRLDILKQSIDAYKKVWPDIEVGILTGETRENEKNCEVLFASKDTLRQPTELMRFGRNWFAYIVVDEVHHGQSPTYREVLTYFEPSFMLGMTATPDRTDRKDIFELFNYNKIYEIPLSEVIERGYLVPYTYHGLTDNIDYSKIRYQDKKYRVDDLERHLIIPERNEAILKEYLEKGQGDKAIGFCVSIKHAERMAEFFCSHGISAVSIHSGSSDRDQLISGFRDNKYQVAFTVDLFNEGVDFPNVRVLLFLRPTESKTVFIQQLGRGLRLCAGKERVRILDFIGNYRRANQIRKYLSKASRTTQVDQNGRRQRKIEYVYSTGCEVVFDQAVERILDRQDAQDLGVSKEDLKEAYFTLAEKLGRKPSRSDLDADGEYKSLLYATHFGSWIAFLREVGEYTEASYHYPQGVHLGHILSILKIFGKNNRTRTHFDDEYIRLHGGLGEGRIATYRRQVKYKLLAAMELGLLTDNRNYSSNENYIPELTPLGKELYSLISPMLERLDLSFQRKSDGFFSTRMGLNDREYNQALRKLVETNEQVRDVVFRVFLSVPAVQQMLAFLYHVCRTKEIQRNMVYEQFFQAPFVKLFCDQEGIEEATLEASKRRCPFLLNVLDACGITSASTGSITVHKLVLASWLVRPHEKEEQKKSHERLRVVGEAYQDPSARLSNEGRSIIRERFGADSLTPNYHLGEGYRDLSSRLSNENLSIVRELFGVDFLTPNYYLKDFIIFWG